MANSYVLYTSVAGGTTNLNVPFSYLDVDQVELYIDDVLKTKVTHWDFTNPTTIALVTPTSGGEDILIKRATNIASAEVTFSNAMLVDTDLNTSHLQNFYLHQELLDNLALGDITLDGTSLDATGITDGYVLTADGAGNVAWEVAPTGPTGATGPTGPTGADGTSNIVLDTTPQLGGNLDANGNQIIADAGTVALPGLAFGDGDTGFYESADDTLQFASGGISQFEMNGSYIRGTEDAGQSWRLENSSMAPGSPAFCFHTDNNSGLGAIAADSIALIAGGLEVIRVNEVTNAVQAIIDPGVTGSNALPSLAFGDGDSGFFEASDDSISTVIAGVAKWSFNAQGLSSGSTNGPTMVSENATSTNPTLIPNKGDLDTGIGWSVADQLSLIAGGLEVARATETAAAGQLIVDPGVTGTAALPSLAFGDGNTGFYESADNDLTMTTGGTGQFVFSPGEFRSTVSTAAMLKRATGTVGAPAFTFWNDEDCGMWRTAADSIAFSAGGIEAMRMSESGSLISTTMGGDVSGNFITPVNGQAANYTMLLSDAGKTIRFTGSTAAQTYTIPANASVAYPIGTMIGIENDGTVSISLAITTDTLTWSKDNTTGTRTLAAGASAVIKKTTATTWKISGSALVT